MNLTLLRRLGILLGVSALLLSVGLQLFNQSAALLRASQSVAGIEEGLAEIAQRQAHLAVREAQASDPGARGALRASDASAAASLLNARLHEAVTAGQLLTLNINAQDNGVAEARLLWRGSEAQLRALLEDIRQGLPALTWGDTTLRRVEMNGLVQIELDARLQQAWREEGA